MAILSNTDFTGKWKISQGSFTSLTSYITKYEDRYLLQLFGQELYDLFKDDLVNGVPQSPRFVKIFDPLTFQSDCRCIYISEGIKDMLKGFIYFQYVRDQKQYNTISGQTQSQSEVSENVDPANFIYTRYNEAADSYKSIAYYMSVYDKENYQEYKGVELKYALPI